MTAQALEGVIHPSMNLHNQNQTSFSADAFILTDKVSTATTLALLVGLVQVNFHIYRRNISISNYLVSFIVFTSWILNSLFN